MSNWNVLTFPLGLVVPGHNGFVGSNSGMSSICGASDWPLHGRCKRCGLTRTHWPINGLKRQCWCSTKKTKNFSTNHNWKFRMIKKTHWAMMKCFRHSTVKNCHLPVEINVDILSEQFSKYFQYHSRSSSKNITLWMLFISVRMVSVTVLLSNLYSWIRH